MFREQRIRAAAELEGGEQVGFEDAAPLVFAVVQHRAGDVAAGVVDQQVQAALVGRPVEDLGALFLVGDVGRQCQHRVFGAGEFIFQFGARLLQRVGVARDHQHLRAQAQQLAADGQADAGTGAGHQCALSVQGPAVRWHARLRCLGSGVG